MSRFKKSSNAFQLMAKPVGPMCNINCDYCFYLEKEIYYKGRKTIMSNRVLESFIRKYIESQNSPEVEFIWQGGEPTLAGLDFYKRAVAFQKEYSGGKIVRNSFQTNGLLLNKDWCNFFRSEKFLVGISLDGPKEINDIYRKDVKGNSTFDSVMRSVKLMQNYGVEFNVMACVGRGTSEKPLETYQFFKDQGIDFIQFTPIVERTTVEESAGDKLKPWSVNPEDYGNFLIEVFDEWIKNDVGSMHVMNFEWALASWLGLPPTLCVFSKRCGNLLIIEHNGDIYSCDHYMYPEYLIGNILESSLYSIVESQKQISFGSNKENIPELCINCEVLFACHGGCSKHRFIRVKNEKYDLNYLCPSYKKFYLHADKYMKQMAELILKGKSASEVMKVIDNSFFNSGS